MTKRKSYALVSAICLLSATTIALMAADKIEVAIVMWLIALTVAAYFAACDATEFDAPDQPTVVDAHQQTSAVLSYKQWAAQQGRKARPCNCGGRQYGTGCSPDCEAELSQLELWQDYQDYAGGEEDFSDGDRL